MFVITGGGSGIGQALAHALSDKQETVLIIGRRESQLQETAAYSSYINYLCADVSSNEGLEHIKDSLKQTDKIKALINNAGLLEPIEAINKIDPQSWQRTISTNLNAPLFLPQKLEPQLQGGRVLNIGSGAAYFAVKGWAAYCVSKAALSMLTRCWQLESKSIAFASVMPGIIDTQMQALARTAKHMDSDQLDFYKRLKEHKRLIPPQTVAQFLVWLLEIEPEIFINQEWDIYDSTHHADWLRPPHKVLHWDF